eukprot:gnl/TRDRNA2_/TRDRNA2_173802_c3_seq1.p1 gnl/TRDRNA2_/TRDRNA2_173802_c3~~gnl/TRDRNA2_/TRDRNA2_173802_c3_seq1.p1  ORF type:complete len:362 (-),score=43.75 gnl/TRDRNA2_/TRDRNA2_173802_c3_seq1:25-951(-)
MWASGPRAKILDFGLSRVLTRNAKPLGGTMTFMAPEVATSSVHTPSGRADVYSFGMLSFLIVTGQMPFKDSISQLTEAIKSKTSFPPLEWPPEQRDSLIPECRRLCDQCAAERDSRPDMISVYKQLRSWLPHEETESFPAADTFKDKVTAEADDMDIAGNDCASAILKHLANEDETNMSVWIDALTYDIFWCSQSFLELLAVSLRSENILDWMVRPQVFTDVLEPAANSMMNGTSQEPQSVRIQLRLLGPGPEPDANMIIDAKCTIYFGGVYGPNSPGQQILLTRLVISDWEVRKPRGDELEDARILL